MPMHGQVEGVFVARVEPRAAPRSGTACARATSSSASGRARVRSVKQFIEALRTAEQPLRLSLLRGDYRIQLVIR